MTRKRKKKKKERKKIGKEKKQEKGGITAVKKSDIRQVDEKRTLTNSVVFGGNTHLKIKKNLSSISRQLFPANFDQPINIGEAALKLPLCNRKVPRSDQPCGKVSFRLTGLSTPGRNFQRTESLKAFLMGDGG